jgi:hypothetical protein
MRETAVWACVYKTAGGWRPICFIYRRAVLTQVAFLRRYGFKDFGPVVKVRLPRPNRADRP